MYEIGMYGGTFNPLHLGHVNDIIMAKNQCKKLYIPISISDDPKEIDEKTRITWLKNITQDRVELNMISAGQTVDLAIPITLDKQDNISKDTWGRESKVILEATYVNEDNKERKVEKIGFLKKINKKVFYMMI